MGRNLVIILWAFTAIAIINWLRVEYLVKPYDEATFRGYKVHKQVAEKVFQDADKQQFGYFIYTPDILTYNMEYMIWWLDYTKYHLNAENKKHPTTYLIMYPAPDWNPGAPEYWKKSIIRTNGKTISKMNYFNYITVEKLSVPANDPEPDPNYINTVFSR